MSNRSAAVDAYIANAAAFAQPVLVHLRELMHKAAPDVVEEIKWSHPFFVYKGIILASMSGFKAHCSFGLWGEQVAAAMRTGAEARSGGMGTFGKIKSLEDLPPGKALTGYIKQATRAIDDGARTKAWTRPPRVVKSEVEVPEALAAALGRSKSAAAKFEAMSPGCRREYSEWISDAKREETRHKRVAQAVEWIAEGKGRNWKYER